MKNPLLIALLSSVAAVGLGESRLSASPVAYSIETTTPLDYLGGGTFTIDVGAPLGSYLTTDPLAGGSTFGTWDSIEFRAEAGTFASLVISNLVAASFTLSLPGIGGGEIQSRSQADLEWENFITQASAQGLRITPRTTSVPDGGPSAVLASLVLGGLCLLARPRPE